MLYGSYGSGLQFMWYGVVWCGVVWYRTLRVGGPLTPVCVACLFASTSNAVILGIEPRLPRGALSRSSHTSDLNPGTVVATLLQKSALRLRRLRTLPPTEMPRHFPTPGPMETLSECGQADQTPDHVLQSCPKYADRRQLTWPHGADLRPSCGAW